MSEGEPSKSRRIGAFDFAPYAGFNKTESNVVGINVDDLADLFGISPDELKIVIKNHGEKHD